MKIRHLSIKNFRGIRQMAWAVPETGVVCLIGRGDSTKSSILDAIRYTLFPAWNLSVDTFDFFTGNTDDSIEIIATIGDLPDEFLSDAKYGEHLRGWNEEQHELVDEPSTGLEEVVSVRFAVDNTMEPKWTVTTDRKPDGKTFALSDRAQTRTTFIGAYTNRHLTWGKNTALSRLTESESIAASLGMAATAAKKALDAKRSTDLAGFDTAAKKAEEIAKRYGVPVSEDGAFRAHLDTTAVNIQQGGLSLHDNELPVRTLGLGSRRMLTLGIEQHALDEAHITLIDEVEIGLEPHRVARLLRNIESDSNGQYFLTTHSPAVLRELDVKQLFIAKSEDHRTEVVAASQPGLEEIIQGKVRSGAAAFLAANVIVCEGATEVGLGRGLDTYWIEKKNRDPFSFTGTVLFDAQGGSKIKDAARAFQALGYRVAAIGDSDANDNFSEADAQALGDLGIHVIRWEGGVTLEQFLFTHLPWEFVTKSVLLAKEIHGEGVLDQVKNHKNDIGEDIASWVESPELRDAIGKTSLGNAKNKNVWFKRQSWAERWASKISGAFEVPGSVITEKIEGLEKWVAGE